MKKTVSRRDFFKKAGMGTIGLGIGITAFDGIRQRAEALTEAEKHALLMKGTVNFKGFMASEITPNDQFYITTYSDNVPDINPQTFTLQVGGLVEKPYALSLKELEEMKDTTEFVTFECIGNPVGGSAISNALWEGVKLRRVMERAMPKPGILKAAFHAADGYTDSIPYQLVLSDDVFLAFRMNGEPLPPQHGHPLRVVVPGIYGMKSVKWLSKIELVNYNFEGYWEKRGWSDSAVLSVMSEILMPMDGAKIPPGHYVVGGVAFGGRFGISKVQVSTNGSAWHDAEIKKPLSRWAWTLWRYDWNPVRTGNHTLKVRAFDLSGKVQESGSFFGKLFGSTFPDGASGIHSVTVTVAE